ncbi:hypothetical protein MSAS_06010 [Mycobacterium saskatchewanense]|nr:hypothetical protein MSAS_06010 [Mycobacterium saskatchewanense]
MAHSTSQIRPHVTPTSSSWLNSSTKKPGRDTHTSVRQLDADIRAWIDRPYVWTKTADQNPGQIGHHCARINEAVRIGCHFSVRLHQVCSAARTSM